MDAKQLQRLRSDLADFLDDLAPDRLGNVTRRRWAEVYLRGLLLTWTAAMTCTAACG